MQEAEKDQVQLLEQHSPSTNVGNDEEPPAIPSSSENVALEPAKRPTRQWAAWTREEEESFFTALRQVGKNFEKITCRVQSKNKDQVRHYYYRLVRRMNKLLGPGLSLDAKDSKDTNAAMLRWWSLLEKYSCKASKLHLKPRRFKIFVEALEHQLTKDRKKNVKKRAVQGENYSSPSPTTTAAAATNQNKLSGNDGRAVKVVVVDNQNVQKGQGRGTSTKRNSNIGVIRTNYKGESSHTKSTRQRRKAGAVSTAAMKKWEKAAMAGVSLVADAAEHLERTAGPSGQLQANSLNLSIGIGSTAKKNVQAAVKLKLQLFPIDESTRKALEMDKHNPHLELTLSSRKKISSVLEHLDQKWGTSNVASGELMIFPYNIQRENLLNHQRWTRQSLVTAAEVYDMIGSPPVFRLRYGWISHTELQSGSSDINFVVPSGCNVQEIRSKQALKEQALPPTEEDKLKKLVNQILSNHQISESQNKCLKELTAAISSEANKNVDVELHNKDFERHNFGFSALSKRNEFCEESSLRIMEKVPDQRASTSSCLSAREWADNLTNAAFGGILDEASDAMDADCVETPVCKSSQCPEPIPFSCDSFDAAIAAHISSQNKIGFTEPPPHSSSIWDAEETCDAFLFRNRTVSNNQAGAAASVSGAGLFSAISTATNTKLQDPVENPIADKNVVENSATEKNVLENSMAEKNVLENPMDECPDETHEAESSAKDFSSLTDIYWPESLGPLELDIPSCKYYNEGLILSDSMSGLNRLLASSLDAFQNCPFFGSDEKTSPSTANGAQGSASFAGKIGTGDTAGVQSLEV